MGQECSDSLEFGGSDLESFRYRDLRFIFQDRGVELYFSFLGNHDEIRALLRRGRYR